MLSSLYEFPFEAKQTFWGKKQVKDYGVSFKEVASCMGRHLSLLSYYFTPNGALAEQPMYRHLFGDLIAGIDNNKEWEEFTDVNFGGCYLYYPYALGMNSTPEDCVVSATAAQTGHFLDVSKSCVGRVKKSGSWVVGFRVIG